MSTDYEPCAKDTKVNKTPQILFPHRACILVGERDNQPNKGMLQC